MMLTPSPIEIPSLLDDLANARSPETRRAAQRAIVGMHSALYEARKESSNVLDPDTSGENLLKALIPSFCTVRRITRDADDALVRQLAEADAVNKGTSVAEYRRTRLSPRGAEQYDKETYILYFEDTPVMAVNAALVPVTMRDGTNYPRDEALQGAIQDTLSKDAVPLVGKGPLAMMFYGVTNFRHDIMGGVPLADALFGPIAAAVRNTSDEPNKVVPAITGIDYFSTLSPVPGFSDWLNRQNENILLAAEARHIEAATVKLGLSAEGTPIEKLQRLMKHPVMTQPLPADAAPEARGVRLHITRIIGDLGLEYLLTVPHEDPQRDPAAFHWAKGAYLGGVRVNNGGLMANHVYERMDTPTLEGRGHRFKQGDTITAAPYLLERFEQRMEARGGGLGFVSRYKQEAAQRPAKPEIC